MDAFFDVQRRLKDSSRGVRLGALATLQQLEQAATLAELADDVGEMLFDSDDSVRENALVTLCKMKLATLAPHANAVAARLEDSVWQVRTVALVTLGELEAATLAKHADAGVQRLEDSNEDVRAAATQTLEKLQPSALAQLAVAMHENNVTSIRNLKTKEYESIVSLYGVIIDDNEIIETSTIVVSNNTH